MSSQSNSVGTIQNIWRYAVKSMGGEELNEALVIDGGLLGDRGYAVIDQASGKVGSAKMPKKWSSLLTLNSAYSAPPRAGAPLPPVQINWPGGDSVVSDMGDADASLSETVGRPVKLTGHEYRVLAYLMHHADEVVSRSELIEHIYAQDFDRDSNTIEVFIRRLRQKLDNDAIVTVRGFGYRFDAHTRRASG